MAKKISDYTNETNEIAIDDLLDISQNTGVGTYESKRLKRDAINNALRFSGGVTEFKGEDDLSTDSAGHFMNDSEDTIARFRNDRSIAFGLDAPSAGFFHFRAHNDFGTRVDGSDSNPNNASVYVARWYYASATSTWNTAMQIRNNGRIDMGLANNVHVGGTAAPSEQLELTGVMSFNEEGSDPSGTANKGKLYTKDVAGTTQLFYCNSAGTVTQLS
jgi:hypothetical protein